MLIPPPQPLTQLTTNTLELILVAPHVPLVSSSMPTSFTFANNAVLNALPAKTLPKSASMMPHVPRTSFTLTVTAVVWPFVLMDFTPTPPTKNAPNVIQAAVCAQAEL